VVDDIFNSIQLQTLFKDGDPVN